MSKQNYKYNNNVKWCLEDTIKSLKKNTTGRVKNIRGYTHPKITKNVWFVYLDFTPNIQKNKRVLKAWRNTYSH